ncbi:TetR/AcrR family transcriptional regulator [Nocardioides dongkuii]|uniref:TetR/AcrR family transcriptional regulator n=1 Tax=Nocardioides dongkuii TaxID=2760089 RepID=UPI0015FC6D2B|nr:TetR/AcrR family transcriptional regulator [Nocardioides dongkuii]
MTESATGREGKRQRTERRIARCAQLLTEKNGLDGFTMDELAEVADVSRRTLFNYYPTKLDAVLGPMPSLTAEARATFVAGGPTGDLLEDLSVIAGVILGTHDVERDDVDLTKRVVVCNPRLVGAVHERFEDLCQDFADLVVEREGSRIDARSARLLIRLLVSVFDAAMTAFVDGADRPLPVLFDENLRTARTLLA